MSDTVRYDWTVGEIDDLIGTPFMELLARAHETHRQRFPVNVIEAAMLLSIKTGACPEDCSYCPQSSKYNTGLRPEPLMDLADIVTAAENAKAAGATRFCMGAAWRSPNDRQVGEVAAAVTAVGELGLESCVTLGMLTDAQAETLASAGLDFYNHNLDTSPEFYGTIITTRTYDDRLDTLRAVREAGISVCCGGIIGMGESRRVRAGLIHQLAIQHPHPESVPVNQLIQVEGTPLHGVSALDGLEFVRTVAACRITMPDSIVRLSAGRSEMSDELQALCFYAGANSIFLGDKLLTAPNAGEDRDRDLLNRLGITISPTPLRAAHTPV